MSEKSDKLDELLAEDLTDEHVLLGESLAGVEEMARRNPVFREVLLRRRINQEPVVKSIPRSTLHPAILGGFSCDGLAGDVKTVQVQLQMLFRAEEIHATDWVPQMVPVDEGYCGFYLRYAGMSVDPTDEPPFPAPKSFDVVDEGRPTGFKAQFYPPPGSNTRILTGFVGSCPQNISGATSAFARWVSHRFMACNPAQFISFQIQFIRDAHFEAVLRGKALP